MISAHFDGYVTKQPITQDGQYGRYIEITLRVATSAKEVHYVTSRFYGKKIRPIEEFVKNGDYMTMTGCVSSVKEKPRRESGKYCQFYLQDAYYTLPPKGSVESRLTPSLPSGSSGTSLDYEDFFD